MGGSVLHQEELGFETGDGTVNEYVALWLEVAVSEALADTAGSDTTTHILKRFFVR